MTSDVFDPAVADLVTKADKLWFRDHPDRSHRIRQALAGELAGVTSEYMVVIRQVFPGLRLRWPFIPPAPLPPGDAPEWFARWLFEEIARHHGLDAPVWRLTEKGQAALRNPPASSAADKEAA